MLARVKGRDEGGGVVAGVLGLLPGSVAATALVLVRVLLACLGRRDPLASVEGREVVARTPLAVDWEASPRDAKNALIPRRSVSGLSVTF